MAGKKHTVSMTTGVARLSFPHLFPGDGVEKDNGELSYEGQFLIPKTDREACKAILRAIKEVGEAQWGAEKWKKVRSPLRDGDREAGDLTEDGSTKGEKYPERLGHFFLNARSKKPIGVFDRSRAPITDKDAVYGGCFVKAAVTFYPYSQQGNHGIGASLDGVQFIRDGEPLGATRPSVESMFDLLDDEEIEDDEFDLDEPEEEEEVEEVEEKPAAKKTAAKKTAAKKTAAKKTAKSKAKDDDEDDLYDDLDDI